jgi:hypothetical protein
MVSISAGSRLLNWIEYDKQLRLYSWQPWWIIIALVKRQQRQSYVVQARRWSNCTCLWKVNSVTQLHVDFLLLKDYYLDEKNRLFCSRGFTNMNGVTYEFFPKLFYWDRTLWETALSLDQRIKPIYFIQND